MLASLKQCHESVNIGISIPSYFKQPVASYRLSTGSVRVQPMMNQLSFIEAD